jgi:protein-L-isoaspartate O-methyltransferase
MHDDDSRIMCTRVYMHRHNAAAESIPSALVEQLAPGGRMIIPVGRHGWSQARPFFPQKRCAMHVVSFRCRC